VLTPQQQEEAKKKYQATVLGPSGIAITEAEWHNNGVGDFHLNFDEVGMWCINYFNIERLCGRELIMFPGQTCPEHRHPPLIDYPGKLEIFRCRWGQAYIYVPGEPEKNPKARLPKGRESYYTIWHEIVLNPGEQYILQPNTLHWFQAGPNGLVLSEFSTRAYDYEDIFTDPVVQAGLDAEKKAQQK
jgi:D-lyxose ketol-isomerase